jgi:hypothetical protein
MELSPSWEAASRPAAQEFRNIVWNPNENEDEENERERNGNNQEETQTGRIIIE